MTRILRALRSLAPDDRDRRTIGLRDLGQAIVELREHFITGEGQPDWPGRSGWYRTSIQNCYTAAGYSPDEADATKKAARYHIANALRMRLTPEEITALGMRVETPAERQVEIRERSAAIVAAHTSADTDNPDDDTPEAKLGQMLEALAILKRLRINRKRANDPSPEAKAIRAKGRRTLEAIVARAQDLIRQTPE